MYGTVGCLDAGSLFPRLWKTYGTLWHSEHFTPEDT